MNDSKNDVLRALRECYGPERADVLLEEFAAGSRSDIASRLFLGLVSAQARVEIASAVTTGTLDVALFQRLFELSFQLADIFVESAAHQKKSRKK